MREIDIKLRGVQQSFVGIIDFNRDIVAINGIDYKIDQLPYDIPKIGTIYGTLLNVRDRYEALVPEMENPPYHKPPQAPVLYIKPENTFASFGMGIPMPANCSQLEMGASLGVVIGKHATRVAKEDAFDYVYGYTIVNDVSIPHHNVHRPAVMEKARDRFCPIGPWIMKREFVKNPDQLPIRVFLNHELKLESNTNQLIRPIDQLIQDVTEFMTLYAGDILLVGVPNGAPLAQVNDHVHIEIEDVGFLENRVIEEDAIVLGGDVR